jgi:hypothetical protein
MNLTNIPFFEDETPTDKTVQDETGNNQTVKSTLQEKWNEMKQEIWNI